MEKRLPHEQNEHIKSAIQQELQVLQAQLDEDLQRKIDIFEFHSRAKYYEHGEWNSKYFFTLAKSRYKSKTMGKICTADQKVITDMNQILEAQYHYYDKLYTKNSHVEFQVRNRTGVKISMEQKDILDQPVSLEELHAAVKQFPADKTPGVDGLTAEFYVHFWDKIAY